jgi:hypothetical protein
MTLTQKKMLWYVTIRLKWKTGFTINRKPLTCSQTIGKYFLRNLFALKPLGNTSSAIYSLSNHWEILPPQSTKNICLSFDSFGLVSTDNALYAVGGTMEKSADAPVSFIECYDPRKDAWEEIHVTSSRELERDNAGVVGSHDQIVISGGFAFTSCSVTSSVAELNPTNGEWRELASLHTAREGHVAIVDDVSIYVIGGKNQSGYLSSVERYDKDTGIFTFCAYVDTIDINIYIWTACCNNF